jgi:hypothetical protein
MTITENATDYDTLAEQINANAVAKGFWEADRNMGEMLMLAVSELAEALEEHRDDRPAVWHLHAANCTRFLMQDHGESDDPCICTPKPEGAAVELADCIIRCLDTMHSEVPGRIHQLVREAGIAALDADALPPNFADALGHITDRLSAARKGQWVRAGHLARAIVECEALIFRLGESPEAVVAEKMHYNTTRPYKHGRAY